MTHIFLKGALLDFCEIHAWLFSQADRIIEAVSLRISSVL